MPSKLSLVPCASCCILRDYALFTMIRDMELIKKGYSGFFPLQGFKFTCHSTLFPANYYSGKVIIMLHLAGYEQQ